jgi:hypothetical protein
MALGGPILHMSAQKPYTFEDHPYCGPVVVDRNGEPLHKQPGELDLFWTHATAWYQQGKKTRRVGDKTWCVYETEMRAARKRHANARAAAIGAAK